MFGQEIVFHGRVCRYFDAQGLYEDTKAEEWKFVSAGNLTAHARNHDMFSGLVKWRLGISSE